MNSLPSSISSWVKFTLNENSPFSITPDLTLPPWLVNLIFSVSKYVASSGVQVSPLILI